GGPAVAGAPGAAGWRGLLGAATGAAGGGAGAGGASGTAAMTGPAGGVIMPGGSSSAVYSRERRPAAQFISTSTSMNGSVTGRVEVILMYGWPLGRRSIVMRAPASAGLY